jgi:hypothetical protein
VEKVRGEEDGKLVGKFKGKKSTELGKQVKGRRRDGSRMQRENLDELLSSFE